MFGCVQQRQTDVSGRTDQEPKPTKRFKSGEHPMEYEQVVCGSYEEVC
jgi:hypothetical protein